MIFEVVHQMALLPLLWLGGLWHRGHRRGAAWFWLALAFFVSWLADSAVDLGASADLVGNLYPVTQAAIVGFVLLDRRDAMLFAAVLVAMALVAVLWRGPFGFDVMLRTVAWGGVAGIVWELRAIGRARVALLVSFGLALVAWYGYAAWPGWPSWLLYQAVRAVGIALFCAAATDPRPSLTVAR